MRLVMTLGMLLVVTASCEHAARHTSDLTSATPSGELSGYVSTLPGVQPVNVPDLSKGFGFHIDCDYASPLATVSKLVSNVGQGPGNPDAAVIARAVAVQRPRYNTPDGQRPSQAQADAMGSAGVRLSVLTPITFDVIHVYRGSIGSAQRITGYALVGRIGQDEDAGCEFGSPRGIMIRDGPDTLTVGDTYVVFLWNKLDNGDPVEPYVSPAIENIFVVRGDNVIGLSGSPEPLPT